MAEGVLAIQEEQVRVGGVNLSKKTVIAATHEGYVCVSLFVFFRLKVLNAKLLGYIVPLEKYLNLLLTKLAI